MRVSGKENKSEVLVIEAGSFINVWSSFTVYTHVCTHARTQPSHSDFEYMWGLIGYS